MIGGYFPYGRLLPEENGFLAGLCPSDGQLAYTMTGRCGILYCLEDIKLHDTKRVAYVPIYTCETVLAPYHKAGYDLVFYDLDENLAPVFDESVLDHISVLALCGYYGFAPYDRAFVKKCRDHGIEVVEDVTHTVFSADGVDPECTYVTGSLRKWIGVPAGGFAVKCHGSFGLPLLPHHEKHIAMRTEGMERRTAVFADHPEYDGVNLLPAAAAAEAESATDELWASEMLLRQIFDTFDSDDNSTEIMKHFDVDTLKAKRRENYRCLLDHVRENPKYRVVFPYLPEGTVPSHFTLYVDDPERFAEFLHEKGIGTTVYWPVGPLIDLTGHPTADFIYHHVISIPCDQRYDTEDMIGIAERLAEY